MVCLLCSLPVALMRKYIAFWKNNLMLFTKQQGIHLLECYQSNYHLIFLHTRRTLHRSAMIAPNVQILSPISQVHRPLVLRGAVDGFINVLADACPRPCLLERLAAAQLGPGGVALLTDKPLPSHTHTETDCCWIWSRFLLYIFLFWENENRLFGTSSLCLPLNLPFHSNQGKTLTLMASQVGLMRGGNCVALARVMHCLLWIVV